MHGSLKLATPNTFPPELMLFCRLHKVCFMQVLLDGHSHDVRSNRRFANPQFWPDGKPGYVIDGDTGFNSRIYGFESMMGQYDPYGPRNDPYGPRNDPYGQRYGQFFDRGRRQPGYFAGGLAKFQSVHRILNRRILNPRILNPRILNHRIFNPRILNPWIFHLRISHPGIPE